MRALAWNVQSQWLVVKCGFISSEENQSCSFTSGAQARHESTRKRGFLSYPAQNVPFLIFHVFFLISPIPFSSQVHLAFIQEFNSALEHLGLYLKPYHWINRAKNLLILPATTQPESLFCCSSSGMAVVGSCNRFPPDAGVWAASMRFKASCIQDFAAGWLMDLHLYSFLVFWPLNML